MPVIIDQILYFIVYAILMLFCSVGILGTFVPLIVKSLPHCILDFRRRRYTFEGFGEEFPRLTPDEVRDILRDESFNRGASLSASITGFIIALVYYFFHVRGARLTADILPALLETFF